MTPRSTLTTWPTTLQEGRWLYTSAYFELRYGRFHRHGAAEYVFHAEEGSVVIESSFLPGESFTPADPIVVVARTITFEDQGQDFIRWDLDADGKVIESHPCQTRVWAGFKVSRLKVGVCPVLSEKRQGEAPMVLKYKVTAIDPPIEAPMVRYEGDEYVFTLLGDVVTVTDRHRPELEPVGWFIWDGEKCLETDLEPAVMPTPEQDDAEAYFIDQAILQITVPRSEVPQLLQDLAEKIGELHPEIAGAALEAAATTAAKYTPAACHCLTGCAHPDQCELEEQCLGGTVEMYEQISGIER